MKRIVVVLAVALVGALASTAAADQGPHGQRAHRGQMRQRLLEKFDHNHDGRLTGREKRAAKRFVMRKRFERRMMALQRFDADQDGWLSPEEQRAARQAFKAKRQARRPRAGN